MSAYLVIVRAYPDQFCAEVAQDICRRADDEIVDVTVHNTAPVVLSGLVKGGEFSTTWEWKSTPSAAIYVDASGRAFSHALRALSDGALPITWYTDAP